MRLADTSHPANSRSLTPHVDEEATTNPTQTNILTFEDDVCLWGRDRGRKRRTQIRVTPYTNPVHVQCTVRSIHEDALYSFLTPIESHET